MRVVHSIHWLLLGAVTAGPAHAMQRQTPRAYDLDGIPYVRLDHVAAMEHMVLDADGLVLSSSRHVIRLAAGGPRGGYDGEVVWLHEPVRRVRRRWGVAKVDVDTLLAPLLRPHAYLKALEVRTIVLDPGHGGKDRGAEGPGHSVEKEVTLDICRRVRNLLIEAGRSVHLTRDDDRFIALAERSRIARGVGADLFISVHFNSSENTNAVGIEVYALTAAKFHSTSDNGQGKPLLETYSGNHFDPSNAYLAKQVHHHLLTSTRAMDRGLRRARFAVLREAPCPATLLECGFLSNSGEEDRILSPSYRQQLAEGITAGIREYMRAVNLARAGAE